MFWHVEFQTILPTIKWIGNIARLGNKYDYLPLVNEDYYHPNVSLNVSELFVCKVAQFRNL